MTMPVDADILTAGLYHLINYKANQGCYSGRRHVSTGVADHNCAGSAVNCRFVKTLDRFRIATRGVLGHVHHFKINRARELNGLLGCLQKEVIGPVLRIASNWTGADKSCCLDGNSDLLLNVGNGTNVVLVRTRRAVPSNREFGIANLARQPLYIDRKSTRLNSSHPS